MNWIELKALNTLYTVGEITLNETLAKSGEINYLIKSLRALDRSHDKLLALEKFKEIYQNDYQVRFEEYKIFLSENDILKPQTRFEENDIKTLMFIARERKQLTADLTNSKSFSSLIFNSSKYLENKPGLKEAVCKILGISDFPDKDPKNLQWRFVVDCVDPKLVVLCENIAQLKSPSKALENNIELWYVGGNNIGILDNIGQDKLSKPLYYLCDWDKDGLLIYSRIKKKLESKSCHIKLLLPNTYVKAIPVTSPYHDSFWDHSKPLSGLNKNDFSVEALQLVENLINEDKWIEEESMDLLQLLANHL